jgi:hypothetical protein
MRKRIALATLLSLVVAATADAKPKKKKHRSHRHRSKKAEPVDPAAFDVSVDPPTVDSPTRVNTGESAGMPDVPRPMAPLVVDTVEPAKPRPRSRGPGWFFGVRGGPSAFDRRGFNEYKTDRAINEDWRNLRGELALGHYVGRHVALALAAGAGPFPKFDDVDPLLDVNTRYYVRPAQARLDFELHAAWLTLAVGGGVAYEQAAGTFSVGSEMHESVYRRFGGVGTARTGFQIRLGALAVELLASATAIKLMRGTYDHGTSSPGPSDREMCYEGSVLLGLRLQ